MVGSLHIRLTPEYIFEALKFPSSGELYHKGLHFKDKGWTFFLDKNRKGYFDRSKGIPREWFNEPWAELVLHNNFSPSLQFPIPHIGGLIPWPVGSDITWKHFHGIPLDMEFHSPEDISLWKTLKIAFSSLVQLASVIPAPMGEILQRGCANWRSVLESHSHQA